MTNRIYLQATPNINACGNLNCEPTKTYKQKTVRIFVQQSYNTTLLELRLHLHVKFREREIKLQIFEPEVYLNKVCLSITYFFRIFISFSMLSSFPLSCFLAMHFIAYAFPVDFSIPLTTSENAPLSSK